MSKKDHTGINELTPRDPNPHRVGWLSKAFGVVYHLWFYFVMFVSIMGLGLGLWWYSRHDEDYPKFYKCAQRWAAWILFGMGMSLRVKKSPEINWNNAYMVVANHGSEMDIMASFYTIQSPIVFIGKAELAKLPLFGFLFKRSSIVVDRKSLRSRRQAMIEAGETLKRGQGMCIFPEGGIPSDPDVLLSRFKLGAFQLAIEHGVDVLPLSFANNRKYFPYIFQGGRPGALRATMHDPISTQGMTSKDAQALADRVHGLILQEIKRYRNIS